MRTLFLIASAALLLPGVLSAQISIVLGQVSTDGTRTVQMDVAGEIGTPGDLELVFRYDADVFDVPNIATVESDLFFPAGFTFSAKLDELDPSTGILTINAFDVAAGQGRWCALVILGLRSSEVVGRIALESAHSEGETLEVESSVTGVVTVTGPPVFFEDAESLGSNFPNPFLTQTEFDYTLAANNVEVRFTVFTLDGIKIYSETTVGRKGANRWKFDPAAAEVQLAQGMYLLLMETPNGVFTLPFQHLR